MAKIFRTEELSVNGDEIRISATDGDLRFKRANESGELVELTTVSSLMLKDVSHDSDVSSLAALNSEGTTGLDSDISSLQAQSDNDVAALDSDISSLQEQSDNDVAALDSDISSLQEQSDNDVAALDSDISSLDKIIETNDIVADEVVFNTDLSTETLNGSVDAYDANNALVYVKFSKAFSTAPRVIGIMKSASGNPIIGCQLVSTSTDHAVFALSDDITLTDDNTAQYSIQVLASVDGGTVV